VDYKSDEAYKIAVYPAGARTMTEIAIATKAMEGGGYYNRHAGLQAAGIELALPFLEAAARTVSGTLAPAPLVIADYGASQGINSMRPMGVAIKGLRDRFGNERPIEVVHTDLPSNDFASLFTTLHDHEDSYLAGRQGIFPSAIGRSYFEPLFAPGRVHLGWNSWTLHWLSQNPVQVDDHVLGILSKSSSAREKVRLRLAEDWRNFLLARSTELAVGAKLVSLSMGATPDLHGWDWILGELWAAAVEMADKGRISAIELERFTASAAGRTLDDICAPFAGAGFAGLSLDHAEVVPAPDPFWDLYCETGDAGQFAKSWAGMIRAVTGPLAMAAFALAPDTAARTDELFLNFEARVAAAPRRHEHFAAIAVIEKTGA